MSGSSHSELQLYLEQLESSAEPATKFLADGLVRPPLQLQQLTLVVLAAEEELRPADGRRRRRLRTSVVRHPLTQMAVDDHLRRLAAAPTRFVFILLLVGLTTLVYSCEKEINDDICPQREGFDKDCEQRCQLEYPHRLSSGCYLRSTGTLLSFFGIKSYICKCRLPEQFCAVGSTPSNLRRSFSVQDLAFHSTLVPLTSNAVCSKPMVPSLSCREEFGEYACAWQRSVGGDWFVADPHSAMPFAHGEAPNRRYLVGVAKGGHGVLQLDTCPALCSTDSVNVTARIWRGPWVNAELCFREEDAIMCAPLRISNGRPMNEVIPQTSLFQISIKFTNVSDGDVILLDDVAAKFTDCPIPANIGKHSSKKLVPKVVVPPTKHRHSKVASALGSSMKKPLLEPQHIGGVKAPLVDTVALRRRLCKEGECATIVHHSSPPLPYEKICIGRLGLLQCRQKCVIDGADPKTSRCVRQRDYPFSKRCLCQLRRSPIQRVDGGSRFQKQHSGRRTIAPAEVTTERPADPATFPTLRPTEEERISDNRVLTPENVCEQRDGDETCNRNCKQESKTSSGRCQADGDQITCKCSDCETSTCDFERSDCEWVDMHMIDDTFSNFSIASKRGRKNRYGLSHIAANGYSGLFRRGPLQGPLSLSVDIYPTEGIDVRICIDSLQRCQTQIVTAKSWNRVRAKIRVKLVERMFLLFFNSADETRTMAMDNVSLKSGQCTDVD